MSKLALPRRMRRVRAHDNIRRLVAENSLSTSDLIWPLFIMEGQNITQPVDSMPGVNRYTLDKIVDVVGEAVDHGIPAIALFPYTSPEKRTADGFEALNPDNLINTATRLIRAAFPELIIMCDVALDPYTDHGHDGLIKDGIILNDETVEVLIKQAITQAEAGCDTIAPSDMMDGRIGAIREGLDSIDREDVRIISYAAKYASAFYGPFRDAVGSTSALKGDKRTYQMDYRNGLEAIREVELDIQEGADMIMVKPGMPYLDIVKTLKDTFEMPTFAYQVSGEYSMLMAAVQNGWMDKEKVMIEALTSFKRAGCNGVLTYFALDVAKYLKEQ